MREIKFRVWFKNHHKMVILDKMYIDHEMSCLGFTADGLEHDGLPGAFDNDDQDVEVMQYTGLKDKNGKEIYEGDIVNFVDERITNYEPTGADQSLNTFDAHGHLLQEKRAVLFSDGGWIVQSDYYIKGTQVGGMAYDSVNLYHILSMEVVGNIYESQELLGEIK